MSDNQGPAEKDWHELSEADILIANIQKYDDDHIVSFYDDEQPGQAYEYLEHAVTFKVVTDYLRKKGKKDLTAIDVCGGAGKAAFMLHDCGVKDIVLLDSAQKMLDIASRKISQNQIEGIVPLQEDALGYLENTERTFDILVFSSAIHHFKDPANLLDLGFKRLAPGGVLITLGDPTRVVSSSRYLNAVDFFLFLTHRDQRKVILKSIPARITGTYRPPEYKDPAEYQAFLGIEDHGLKNSLVSRGMKPLIHFRYPAAPSPILTRIMPYLGLNWAMGMVLAQENNPELSTLLRQAVRRDLPYKVTVY
ncbi:MAG: class I SAM-dependent methyltransferase [Solirubrobacterales bacterium]